MSFRPFLFALFPIGFASAIFLPGTLSRACNEEEITESLKRELRENQLRVNEGRSSTTGNFFVQGRSLAIGRRSYSMMLGGHFLHFLARLGPQHRWMDIGSGPYATAQSDYYAGRGWPPGRAKLAAINVTPANFHDPAALAEFERFKAASGFEFHQGKKLADYKSGEIETSELVTDVAAAITYSENLPLDLEKACELVTPAKLDEWGRVITPGGRFHSVLFEYWGREPCLTIIDQFGKEVPLLEYLKAVKGVKVAVHESERIDQTIFGLQFGLERTSGPVFAPPLKLLSFKNASGKRGERGVPQVKYLWVR